MTNPMLSLFSGKFNTTYEQRLITALFQPRSRRLTLSILLGMGVASSILHLLTALLTHGAYPDINNFLLQAKTVLHGKNIYAATQEYPYPPVWMWIVTAMDLLSNAVHVRFDIIVKIPAIAGDIAIIPILFILANHRYGPSFAALTPAFLFAFNPVPLIISAGHGQFDSLVLACMLLSAIFLTKNHYHLILSSLLLGLAIALKGYPVLFLPYFLFIAPRVKRWQAIAFTSFPLIFSTALFVALFGFSTQMITHVLLYTSPANFGWISVLTNNHQLTILNWMLKYKFDLLAKLLLIIMSIGMPAIFCKDDPVRAIACIFSVFYLTTFSMSAQYFLWILPFLAVSLPIWSIGYSFIAAMTLGNFYYSAYPAALPLTSWNHAFWNTPLAYYDGSFAISLFSGALLFWLIYHHIQQATAK